MEGLTRRQLLKRGLGIAAVVTTIPAEISLLSQDNAQAETTNSLLISPTEQHEDQVENTEDIIFKNFSPEERSAFEKEIINQIDAYKKSGSLRAERVLDWEETTTRIILNQDVPEKDRQFWKKFTSAVVYVESEGKHSVTSASGAIGLTQLTPQTAEIVAKKHSIHNFDLRNGWTALRLSRFYLADLIEKFGVDISVLAYYAGENFAQQKVINILKNRGIDARNSTNEQFRSSIDQYKINISNLGSLDGKEYLTKIIAALRILQEARSKPVQTTAQSPS